MFASVLGGRSTALVVRVAKIGAAVLCACMLLYALTPAKAVARTVSERNLIGGTTRDRPDNLTFLSGTSPAGEALHLIRFHAGGKVRLRCADWRDWRVAVSGQGRAILGRLLTCASKPRGVVLWYHGGPFESGMGVLEPEQVAFLSRDYDVFVPFFPLSADREFLYSPSLMFPDYREAILEGQALASWAESSYGQTIFFGESLGAEYVLPLLSGSRYARAVFMHPYFGGSDELVSGFRVEAARVTKVTGFSFNQFKDIVGGFFAGSHPITGEAVRLAASDKRTLWIYSSKDRRVDQTLLDSIGKQLISSCRVQRRSKAGHVFAVDVSEYNSFLKLLDCK